MIGEPSTIKLDWQDIDTYPATVKQFKLPDGRIEITHTTLPLDTKPLYESMRLSGCMFEAEILRTGQVSVTISNKDEDIDISITPNGPQVQAGMVEMLKRKLWESL